MERIKLVSIDVDSPWLIGPSLLPANLIRTVQRQLRRDSSAGRPNYTMPSQEMHVPFVPNFQGHSGSGYDMTFPQEKGPEGPFIVA